MMIPEVSDGKAKVQTLPAHHARVIKRIDLSTFRGLLDGGHPSTG
jgi:hypothetical protein